jgi:peptidyl-prolyl cis-trans isomerase SurA
MRFLAAIACAGLAACSSETSAPVAAPADLTEAPAAPTPAPPTEAAAPDTSEACAQLVLVAYRGAAHAAPEVTRDKPEAERRARELLDRARAGADFAALAASESDAKSSAARGGVIGTFARDEWPALHAALRDAVFALHVGEVGTEPVAADYGYALVRRCAVEKARSRHILVRYAGAKNAGKAVKRSKQAAEARARALLEKLASGADFAELARAESDDASAERGGDLGAHGRGVLALPYENALFAMPPGQRSAVIESEFGFHIIERLPDAP